MKITNFSNNINSLQKSFRRPLFLSFEYSNHLVPFMTELAFPRLLVKNQTIVKVSQLDSRHAIDFVGTTTERLDSLEVLEEKIVINFGAEGIRGSTLSISIERPLQRNQHSSRSDQLSISLRPS